MKLKVLLKGLEAVVKGSKEVEITGISADSRTVAPGNLFIARKGSAQHGAEFIPQALSTGAVAIVTDLYDPFLSVTQVIVKRPELLEAKLAARFYGNPSKELFVVGVTGTKGKTTTSYLTHHLLGSCGLLSTVETVIGEERRNSTLTTHSAIQNQKLLREMIAKGAENAVIEVSSHGLDQGRVDEIDFDVGVFTNLYPDHLDYHKDIDEYAAAKKKLFSRVKERAILNADSPWAPFMKGEGSTWTFGIENDADIRATQIQGDSFVVEFQGQTHTFQTPLIGRFNIYNALGAMGVLLHKGVPLSQIPLHTFHAAPGRLERVPNDRGIGIYVDFSHSGPALENVLTALRETARKKIICVFGCGGNRDPLRRTQTAQAADKYADISIITSDNPRKEDPAAICEQIRQAFSNPDKPTVIVNRKEAIAHAIAIAEADDIILLAGKGHEKVQIFANQTIPFDDVEVAKEALRNIIAE